MMGTAMNDEAESASEGPAPGSKRNLPRFAVLVIIIAFLGFGLWLSYRPAPRQIEGMVDAREIRITSKVTGRIDRFYVEEGQPVREGELLYTVLSPEVVARSREAQGALVSATAQKDKADEGARSEDIRAAEAQWRQAQAAAALARNTADRTQRLYRQGVLAGQKADEAQANAVASTQAERAARAHYDAARAGTRPQDRAAAGGQVEQASGAVAEVTAAADELRVVAPADGEVGRRMAQPGELVPQGFPVFMLTETQSPWVTLTVREDELKGLARDRIIEGNIPALDKKGVKFRVTFVAPAGDFATWRATRQSSGFDIKSFEVRVVPVEKVRGLRPGMTVLFNWQND